MPMNDQAAEGVEDYDRVAEATGWRGPAVVFALASPYIRPGQTIIDLGIGTGLGSEPFRKAGLTVTGMDISEEMLEICRQKGFHGRLVCHDLTAIPFPFGDASFDHAVSTGVFQFFEDLGPVFKEVYRILRFGGVFVFITGDRSPGGSPVVVVGPEHTGTGAPVMMYCHTVTMVNNLLEESGFSLIGTSGLSVWMDRRRTGTFPMRAYLARKKRRGFGEREKKDMNEPFRGGRPACVPTIVPEPACPETESGARPCKGHQIRPEQRIKTGDEQGGSNDSREILHGFKPAPSSFSWLAAGTGASIPLFLYHAGRILQTAPVFLP